MGFLDLFIEKPKGAEVTNNTQNTQAFTSNQQSVQQPAVYQQQPTVNNTQTTVNTTQSTSTQQVNQEILDKLCAYMETCDLPGPDYMELKKAANSDGMKVIPDEAVRLQAAFSTLKSIHPTFTKDIVLNSIDAYIKELRKQNDAAKAQIEVKRKVEVNDKRTEIANKEKKIAELQQEIVNLSTEVNSMKEIVSATDTECDKNILEFEQAVNLIIGNLETDKQKISEKLIG